MSWPIVSIPFDVYSVVVATCIGSARKEEYRIYPGLLKLHPIRRRDTSSSIISMMQPRERGTAKEKIKASSQGILWEECLLKS
jgi:hypothetical protein